jgi:hypothetical protein
MGQKILLEWWIEMVDGGQKVKLIDFRTAIKQVKEENLRLLLGNGFSRALFNDIFSYAALLDEANFKGLTPNARRAFAQLQTQSFEEVIKALQIAAQIGKLYKVANSKKLKILESDAEKLKDVLIEAIAGNHPPLPNSISVNAFSHCKAFLSNFEKYYSLNYDLLLYWTMMQAAVAPVLTPDDGFRTPEGGPAEFVAWDMHNHHQNTFYLHGALHLFDTETELQKYTWVNTGVPLIEQIREALDQHKFPLFVAEGSSEQKMSRIRHSDYLSRSMRSFNEIGGSLFVFGFSFSSSDTHILNCLVENRVRQLFAGIYGSINKPGNKRILKNISLIQERRPRERQLNVYYYDSKSASVWS